MMDKLILWMGVLCLFSCQGNLRLEQVLKLSGENRAELEKVLCHYQDSGLKLDAARFLIENMPGCQGVDSLSLERLQPVYDAYDAISRTSGYRTDREWGERIDSLAESDPFLLGTPVQAMDLLHVKADYLIKEIDRSFLAWQKNVHASGCSFEDFEYRHLTHSGFRGTRIPVHRAETFEHLRHGLCMHRCWYNSLLLSSLGMPVAVDF